MAFSVALAGCGGASVRPAPVVGAASPGNESAIESAYIRARPGTHPADSTSESRRTEALLQALLALDIDYRTGGASPVLGFDCSGLVAHVFREAYNIRLPRTTREQSEIGIRIDLHELQPGDLVFYNTLERPFSHVGIYLGDNRFVHAPKSGARVRFENLRASYWVSRFNGARRISSI